MYQATITKHIHNYMYVPLKLFLLQDYDRAIEFCLSALKIVNTSSSPNSLRLVPILKEQTIRMKILASTLIRDTFISVTR